MPARTAVVFGDDATGGADVQNGQLSRASGRTAGCRPATTDPSSTRSCTPPGSAATSRPTRAATRVDWHGDPRLARVIHIFALARRECCLVACL